MAATQPGMMQGEAVSVDIQDDRDLVGYCSFRFDTEETLGSRDAEVIYWCGSDFLRDRTVKLIGIRSYELQLRGSARGIGLGKMLIDEMGRIGRVRRMDKVMLTCLKGVYPAVRMMVTVN